MSTDLVVPEYLLDLRTGEQLAPTAENAADLIGRLREYVGDARVAIQACEAIIVEESVRQGTKTLTLGEVRVEIYGGDTVEWDIDFLVEALAEEGCPSDRIAALVKTEVVYKVDRRVEKQLAASNRAYAEAIEAAKTTKPGATRVRVKAG